MANQGSTRSRGGAGDPVYQPTFTLSVTAQNPNGACVGMLPRTKVSERLSNIFVEPGQKPR
jgi:hypothetical protein